MFDIERDTIEHSPDAGHTWNVIECHPRSLIPGQVLPGLDELETYYDGVGNWYRWRQGRPEKRISHN